LSFPGCGWKIGCYKIPCTVTTIHYHKHIDLVATCEQLCFGPVSVTEPVVPSITYTDCNNCRQGFAFCITTTTPVAALSLDGQLVQDDCTGTCVPAAFTATELSPPITVLYTPATVIPLANATLTISTPICSGATTNCTYRNGTVLIRAVTTTSAPNFTNIYCSGLSDIVPCTGVGANDLVIDLTVLSTTLGFTIPATLPCLTLEIFICYDKTPTLT